MLTVPSRGLRAHILRARAVPAPSTSGRDAAGPPTALELLEAAKREGAPAPNRRRVLLASSVAPNHDKAGHPECAARAASIEKKLAEEGLYGGNGIPGVFEVLKEGPHALPPSAEALLQEVAAVAAAGGGFGGRERKSSSRGFAAALASVHDASYLEMLSKSCEKIGKAKKEAIVIEGSPTYATSTTFDDSIEACSAACALVDAVVLASTSSSSSSAALLPPVAGFGLLRPPGHHARPASVVAMGFCLLSTAAVAARHAQKSHGDVVKKVAIYDFDTHHGNGASFVLGVGVGWGGWRKRERERRRVFSLSLFPISFRVKKIKKSKSNKKKKTIFPSFPLTRSLLLFFRSLLSWKK